MIVRSKAGLSLIEISISLMILAIFAVGALAGFRFLAQAKIKKAKQNLSALRLDITRYNTDTGTWPTSLNDLIERPLDEKVRGRWEGPYSDKDLLVDSWGNDFVYQLSRGGKHPFELYSWGPNGEGSPQEEWYSVWEL